MRDFAYLVPESQLSELVPAATLQSVFDRKVLGDALRLLRGRAGISQAETARRAGLSQSVLNRAETGASYLSLESLGAVLRALDSDLRDLGYCVDVAAGRTPKPTAGRPRETWVEGLRQRGINRDSVFGFAYALSAEDPQGEADLIASAQEAARLIAIAEIEQRKRDLDAPEE